MKKVDDATFIPELWSSEALQAYHTAAAAIRDRSRPHADRLLRAAANGEDWQKIEEQHQHDLRIRKLYDQIQKDMASHLCDALVFGTPPFGGDRK